MRVSTFPTRIAGLRLLPAVLGLLLLPTSGWSEPPFPDPAGQLARARAANDNASVVELCRRQLKRAPGDSGTLREMFHAQLKLGDFGRAAETLARWSKLPVPAAVVAEARGDLAQAAGKACDDALAAWKEALAAKPDDAPALLGKIADALDTAGRWPEAVEAFRAFLKVNPDHAARTARLAVCLLNAGRPEEADRAALTAGRIDASDETVKAAAPIFDRLRPQLPLLHLLDEPLAASKAAGSGPPSARLDRALLYYRAGAYAAALEDARRAADDTGGRSVLARLLQGECLWKLGRDKEAAGLRVAKIEDARWFDDPRRCDRLRAPDELSGREDAAAAVRAHAARTLVLLAGNQPVLALEDAETAVRAEEKAGRRTADTEVVLAAALLRNDRPADALAAARRATTDDPKNPDGWALCGRLAQEAADFPAAVDGLSRALALREDAAWLRRRETCLRVLGRNSEANRDARRAAQLAASS